jgi:hypothetical protein
MVSGDLIFSKGSKKSGVRKRIQKPLKEQIQMGYESKNEDD